MTLPLLKTALEPIARRQRTLRLMLWLASGWLALAAIGFFLWQANAEGPGVVTVLICAAVIVWAVLRGIVTAWEPDYVAIARDVERNSRSLPALRSVVSRLSKWGPCVVFFLRRGQKIGRKTATPSDRSQNSRD